MPDQKMMVFIFSNVLIRINARKKNYLRRNWEKPVHRLQKKIAGSGKSCYKETANKNNAVVLFMADTDQTESRITELSQYADIRKRWK